MKGVKVSAEELKFYRIANTGCVTISLYEQTVPAGFPWPSLDYMEEEIDFNDYLKPRPLSTFAVRVQGDSMIGAFIPNGALLLVDKSMTPINNMIVVAVINGEFTVKRYVTDMSGVRLMPANPKYAPIPVTDQMDFRVWGVVTKIIVDPIKLGI